MSYSIEKLENEEKEEDTTSLQQLNASVQSLEIDENEERKAVLQFLNASGIEIEDINDLSFKDLKILVDSILDHAESLGKDKLPMEEYFPELNKGKKPEYTQITINDLFKKGEVKYIKVNTFIKSRKKNSANRKSSSTIAS